jgi:putative superfamily III holin-X
MIDHLLRDLQVLRKADLLIAKIWLNVLVRRIGLFAFAGLIAVFGLGMANVAGFYALQDSVGAVWAATMVALVDFLVAAIVVLVAGKSKPGPDLDLAFDVRKMAVESIQADARDLKLTLDALGQEVKNVKANIVQLVENPLDLAAQKLLIPAALSIIRGMRSKKEHA